jgi:transposase
VVAGHRASPLKSHGAGRIDSAEASAVLGPPKPRHLDTPVLVALENLVPADNFYRHLETKLDLGFVREWSQELYAERGRPSIDPVVFFKLQLIMFFEGIRSERKLVETASLNLAQCWYLGSMCDAGCR